MGKTMEKVEKAMCILYIYTYDNDIHIYIYILYFLEDISYFTFKAILSVDSCLIVNHYATHYQLLLAIIAHNDMVEILLITQHYY